MLSFGAMKGSPDRKHSRSRWKVKRERCRIADARPPAPDREARSIGGIIPAVMKSLGLDQQRRLSELAGEWEQIVGADIARHTRPGRLEQGELLVFVDSSVWLSELARYGRKEMVEKLGNKYGRGKIRSITLRLDPDRRGG